MYRSLDALENASLSYVDSYYDIDAKAVHPGRRTERIVKKSVFKLRPGAYLNGLPTELAQRLYVYLAKEDYKSRFFEERVSGVGRRLGLSKTSPSDIRASLEPACRVPLEPAGPGMKAFLRSFAFVGERGKMKLGVETNREQGACLAEYVKNSVDELKRKVALRR